MSKTVFRDFISEENRSYQFQLGKVLASALSGFVAGVILASIIWGIASYTVIALYASR